MNHSEGKIKRALGGCHCSDPVFSLPLIQGRQRQNELVPGAKRVHQSMSNPTVHFQELALPGIALFVLGVGGLLITEAGVAI